VLVDSAVEDVDVLLNSVVEDIELERTRDREAAGLSSVRNSSPN